MQFSYQARTPQGDMRSGTVEAVSREAAIDILQRSNFIIIDIHESAQLPILRRSLSFYFHRGVPKKEVVIFSKLFQAKVPLIESLKTMMEQTSNSAFKDALLDIAKSVDAGASLSKALAFHKKIFSDFYVSMVG